MLAIENMLEIENIKDLNIQYGKFHIEKHLNQHRISVTADDYSFDVLVL